MSWLVIETEQQGVHVLPRQGDDIACGHEALILCPVCRPVPLRDGPLDDWVVWSHQEPTWPGAHVSRGLDA